MSGLQPCVGVQILITNCGPSLQSRGSLEGPGKTKETWERRRGSVNHGNYGKRKINVFGDRKGYFGRE